MKPGSFDPETAREMVGDESARVIEAKARTDADAGVFDPPKGAARTYWDAVQDKMRHIVYAEQHKKRTERNARKQGIYVSEC